MEGNSLVTQVDNPALIKDLEYSDEEIESYLDLSKILEILIHGTEEDKQKVARNLPGLFPEDKPAILGLKKRSGKNVLTVKIVRQKEFFMKECILVISTERFKILR